MSFPKRAFPLMIAICSLLIAGWKARPPDPIPPTPVPSNQDCKATACIKQNTRQVAYTPVTPSAIGGVDHFGYTWDDDYTSASWSNAWTDLTAGGVKIWDGTDVESDLIQEVNLPFSFKFYEHNYDKVFISSNGIIGFDESVETSLASFLHFPIPHDYKNPNNFVALYWTDLKYVEAYHSSSTIAGNDGHGEFFAVEWYQSTDSNELATLTFEVKLYENGDIALLYDQLTNAPDEKSIGIEDPDGVDGLQYLVNSSGPNEDQLILFGRPEPSRRVKLFPLLQSDFNINRNSTFKVKLRNTGDVTFGSQSDNFNLQIASSDPAWTVSLYDADGVTPLSNHDSNPLPDTNSLAQGATMTITVQVIDPPDSEIADQAEVTLTAFSSQDASKTATAEFVSVVPAPFVHIYRNSKYTGVFGINLEMIAPFYRFNRLVNDHYTGAPYIVNRLEENKYLTMWENNVLNGTNVQYTAVNAFGWDILDGLKTIEDNTGDSRQDILPVSDTASNGKVGVAWIRKVIIDSYHYRENVYLAVLNSKTDQVLAGPINVTSDSTQYDAHDYPYIYRDAAIAATGDDHFYLCWRKSGDFGLGSETQEIFQAIYDNNGGTIKALEMLTTPTANIDNTQPSLVAYSDGQEKVLLLFFQIHNTLPTPIYKIEYAVLNSLGTKVIPISDFYDLGEQVGKGLDSVHLQDNRLGVAWVNTTQDRVNYVILGTDLSKPAEPNILVNPDDMLGWRSADYVSITNGGVGSAVLTWMDASFKERIYYALVNDNGSAGIVSPSMVFRYLRQGVERELEIISRYGNAPYISIRRSMLPLIEK